MKRQVLLMLTAVVSYAAAPDFRLPDTVQPLHYDLDLTLLPTATTYSGRVAIDVDLHVTTPEIWMHGAKIRVTSARIIANRRTIIATATPEKDFLHIIPQTPLAAGKARIEIEFTADYERQATAGIFPVKDGGNSYLYTQMEATDARRAFPCFDEPGFKTPWRITLHVPKDDRAFSYAPMLDERPEPSNMKVVHFAETKPLPTYLVAFAVGPFEIVDAGRTTRTRVPVRVITPKGQADSAKYAASITAQIVDQLESYLGVPYPFAKLDNVALPLAAGFGAMENAGLITFQSSIILQTTAADAAWQRNYVRIATHEIGHHWFGDAVSPQWWDDLWLNESFATWLEMKILQRWKPEWSPSALESVDTRGVMARDSLPSARPVHLAVRTEADMSGIFDGISYEKGAALIAQAERQMGEAQFQSAIRSYINRYSGRNASTSGMLDALSVGTSGASTSMRSFLDQSGVPIVTVKLLCDRTPRLVAKQQQAVPLGTTPTTKRWPIPLCVRYPDQSGKTRRNCYSLTEAEQEFGLVGAPSCPAWVQANDGAKGYYRVGYEATLTDALLTPAADISVAEKISLISDAAALANAGQIDIPVALRLASRLASDPDPIVVTQAIAATAQFNRVVSPRLEQSYADYLQTAFAPVARKLGWQAVVGEHPDLSGLRTSAWTVSASGQDSSLNEEAMTVARRWLDGSVELDNGMAGVLMRVAAQRNDPAFWDTLNAAARRTDNPLKHRIIFSGLSSFRDPALMEKTLQLLIDPTLDARESFGSLAGGLRRGEQLFAFVQTHWEELFRRVPDASTGGGSIIALGAGFCTEPDAQRVEQFFNAHMTELRAPRVLAQTLESIRGCAALRTAQEPAVAAFLSSR